MQNYRVIYIWKVCEFQQSKDFCFLQEEFTENWSLNFYNFFIKKLSDNFLVHFK